MPLYPPEVPHGMTRDKRLSTNTLSQGTAGLKTTTNVTCLITF